MSFDRKYELLEPLPEPLCQPGVRLKAREISSARPVTIHVLPGRDQAENEALLRDIKALPLDEQRHVVELGGYARAAYVVTEELKGNPLLQDWVSSIKARIAAEKPVPPVEVPREPGEFTRLFQGFGGSNPQAAAEPKSGPGEFTKLFQANRPLTAEQPSAPPLPAVNTPSGAPGEFTRLFQGLGASKADVPSPAEQPKPVVDTPSGAPGEFTRLFQGLSASKADVPAPAPAQGEFASFFQALETPKPETTSAPPPPESNTGRNACATPFFHEVEGFPSQAPPPAPPNAPEPGEFTKMFQSPLSPAPGKLRFPSQPQASPAPAPTPREPDGFTRMLESPLVSQEFGGPSLRPAPLPIPQPGTGAMPHAGKPAAEAGPSEYTKIFEAPPKRPAPAAAPAPKPKTPARPPLPKRKKRSSLPLILLVIGFLIVVIGGVVFWAMRG